ncbi:MAG: hypothetical protein J7M32_01075 [Deltaproteobacteria bacterium]|nr:hypothetical protein [Deltaproteobacteria bacterium]
MSTNGEYEMTKGQAKQEHCKGPDTTVTDPNTGPLQEKACNSGPWTRFLKWIAKGAAQSKAAGSFCPT